MNQIAINPSVLNWAAEKAQGSLHSFAEQIAKRKIDRERILEGRLTVSQIEKLAKKAKIPFGYLFLNEPPNLKGAEIPDLRRVQDAEPLSDNFYETLEDIRAKQEWFIEYIKESGGVEIPFVGRFKEGRRSASTIAADIKRELSISDDDRRKSPNAEIYFSRLSEKIESAGILVFKSSIVKSNTKQSLSEKEFRGFAISHNLVPVIFVNGRDAQVASVFTLMHELAHIWIGADGVSDVTAYPNNPTEKLCNEIASRILIPNDIFIEQWKGLDGIGQLAKYFRVSRVVIARRAMDNQLIDRLQYEEIASRSVRVKSTGKPTIYQTLPIRNSKKLTSAVIADAMSGNTLLRDAARLLNVKPSTIISFGKRVLKDD